MLAPTMSAAAASPQEVHRLLAEAAALAVTATSDAEPLPDRAAAGGLRVGIDLGTASCVLVVLQDGADGQEHPIWVGSWPSGALRDGVVVDFAAAIETVRRLKADAERGLGVELGRASTAYPPRIPRADARACAYVCESAGFHDVGLVDEVTAAQHTLEIRDGVVVDVGGGSTGVGIFRAGRLERLDDRPGGGHHLDLMLAGALGLPLEEAEPYKRAHPRESFPILVPGIERVAENVRALTVGAEDLPLHLAGGALMIAGASNVLARYLERTVVTYPHALMITPIGIARSAR